MITGDQFIQMEIFDLDSVYGDTLTCQSSDFSDSVSIVVVPGEHKYMRMCVYVHV